MDELLGLLVRGSIDALRIHDQLGDRARPESFAPIDLESIVAGCTHALGEAEDPRMYFMRAIALQALQRYSEALSDYGEVIRLEPENARAYWYRSEIQFLLGREEPALADRAAALRLDATIADL